MQDSTSKLEERRRRYRSGHTAEWIAAAYLMAKGYRILDRRWKSPSGEIDLIAVRSRRIAFIEVKRRKTDEDAEAAIGGTQRRRIESAAGHWLARRSKYQTFEIGFDVIFIVAGRWPRHIENGL